MIGHRNARVRTLTKIAAGYSTFYCLKVEEDAINETRLMRHESATINIIVIVERKLQDGGSESGKAIKPGDIKFAIWETLHMHGTCVLASLNDHFAALSL